MQFAGMIYIGCLRCLSVYQSLLAEVSANKKYFSCRSRHVLHALTDLLDIPCKLSRVVNFVASEHFGYFALT